jgi:hypothetical protein
MGKVDEECMDLLNSVMTRVPTEKDIDRVRTRLLNGFCEWFPVHGDEKADLSDQIRKFLEWDNDNGIVKLRHIPEELVIAVREDFYNMLSH